MQSLPRIIKGYEDDTKRKAAIFEEEVSHLGVQKRWLILVADDLNADTNKASL